TNAEEATRLSSSQAETPFSQEKNQMCNYQKIPLENSQYAQIFASSSIQLLISGFSMESEHNVFVNNLKRNSTFLNSLSKTPPKGSLKPKISAGNDIELSRHCCKYGQQPFVEVKTAEGAPNTNGKAKYIF